MEGSRQLEIRPQHSGRYFRNISGFKGSGLHTTVSFQISGVSLDPSFGCSILQENVLLHHQKTLFMWRLLEMLPEMAVRRRPEHLRSQKFQAILRNFLLVENPPPKFNDRLRAYGWSSKLWSLVGSLL